ncbi:hypothetical protein ACFWXK_20810 [Streptomyces sp. NPDC059070]|uniref:hypothetical protein n=1 Tax=Streptomyces sp. NPDC059070 TaxID=3346713 RepID=UPI0036A09CD5
MTLTRTAAPSAVLESWLLDRPQLRTGPHAGGVLGGTGDDTATAYAYPEITGYYLTWLAFLETTRDAPDTGAVEERRAAAVAWLAEQLAAPGGPRTRSFLGAGDGADWRNSALFSFDLGMVYRGACATGTGGGPADGTAAHRLRERTGAALDGLRDPDGAWAACVPLPGRAAPPARWSTVPGPHLLKVAGGVLALTPADEMPSVRSAARATLARHATGLAADLPAMSHPALYALEGLLQAEAGGHREHHGELVAAYRLLSDRAADGVLREEHGRPGSQVRTDVLAQLLRIGCVLAGRDELDAAGAEQLDAVAAALVEHIGEDGGLPFTRAESGSLHNTWCAMFAHQALAFHDRLTAGRAIPDSWIRLLV